MYINLKPFDPFSAIFRVSHTFHRWPEQMMMAQMKMPSQAMQPAVPVGQATRGPQAGGLNSPLDGFCLKAFAHLSSGIWLG